MLFQLYQKHISPNLAIYIPKSETKNQRRIHCFSFISVGGIQQLLQQNALINSKLSGVETTLKSHSTTQVPLLRREKFSALPDFHLRSLQQVIDFDKDLSKDETLQKQFVSHTFHIF